MGPGARPLCSARKRPAKLWSMTSLGSFSSVGESLPPEVTREATSGVRTPLLQSTEAPSTHAALRCSAAPLPTMGLHDRRRRSREHALASFEPTLRSASRCDPAAYGSHVRLA